MMYWEIPHRVPNASLLPQRLCAGPEAQGAAPTSDSGCHGLVGQSTPANSDRRGRQLLKAALKDAVDISQLGHMSVF